MMADTFVPAAPALSLLPSWRVWTAESDTASAPSAFPLFDDIRSEFQAAAVVDREFDAVLTPGGEDGEAMEAAARSNAELVDAANEAAEWLGLHDEILEIRVTTKQQIEVIRPFDPNGSLYLYVAFDKDKGKYFDLAHMRIKMIELAFGL
jgi:hypothetical protein